MKAARLIQVATLLAVLTLGSGFAAAGTVEQQEDGNTVWQAGVDGIEIEWNADGSVKRISSKYSTPVEFGDRRGIAKAQIIAEEKAKAAIVRFRNQTSSSARIIGEVDNDLQKATQERETGKKPNVKKLDERTMIEALTEVTTSFASGPLEGVIVLEKGYSDKTDEAWVVVGISDKTIKAARGVKEMGQEQKRNDAPGADQLGNQPSEIRRSNQKDW
jgi:hypothetical protein